MNRLLGEYLRDNCDLTCHQIVIGLRQQVIMRDVGTYTPLGEVLVNLGFVSRDQLTLALGQQQRDLSLLQADDYHPSESTASYLQ